MLGQACLSLQENWTGHQSLHYTLLLFCRAMYQANFVSTGLHLTLHLQDLLVLGVEEEFCFRVPKMPRNFAFEEFSLYVEIQFK